MAKKKILSSFGQSVKNTLFGQLKPPAVPTTIPESNITQDPNFVPVAKTPVAKTPPATFGKPAPSVTSGWMQVGTKDEPKWIPAGPNPSKGPPTGIVGQTEEEANRRFEELYYPGGVAQKEAAAKELAPIEAGIGQLTPEQQLAIQNAKTGENLSGAIAAGVTGAATGAAAGAIFGAGIGVIPGALAGAVTGILSKMRIGKKQTVREAYGQYKTAKIAMGQIAAAAGDPNAHMDPTLAVEAWNYQLTQMLIAESILKQETSNSISRFLSGGQDELNNIEAWRQLEAQTGIYSGALRKGIEKSPDLPYVDYSSPPGTEGFLD